MLFRLARWLLPAALLVPNALRAVDLSPPAGPPLGLLTAVTLTLQSNPDLAVFAYELRAQEARARQAGLRPAPEFAVEVENALGSGAFRDMDSAEETFSLAQVIEFGGKRDARAAAARIGREAIGVEQQAAQLDVLAEVTRRFIQVAAGQEQIALTREATELARTTVAAVQRRVQAAKSPDVELYRARAAFARAEIELRRAEYQLLASRRKLAAMWGEPDAHFGDVATNLYAVPVPVAFETLVGRLEANPDFLRFVSEARLRDAEVRLAQTRRTPDVRFSAGVRRFEEMNDNALVLGFSMPLFAGRQASPVIEEAAALRGQVGAEQAAARVRAEAQIYELYQELQSAIGEVGVLQARVLPQVERALKDTEYAYERGRYGYLERVDAQRAYLDAQAALIQAATNAQTFQAEIERLTGEPLAIEN